VLTSKTKRLGLLAAGLLATAAMTAGASASGPAGYNLVGTGAPEFSGEGAFAPSAGVNKPRRMSVAATGILIADTQNHRVREVRWDGTIVTVAGTGVPGDSGDGGPATLAQLNEPASVAALPGGGFLIADRRNERVRKVSPDGTISPALDEDDHHFDGGGDDEGNDRWIERPQDVSVTPDGGFLIADSETDRIVKVDAEGELSRFAGTGMRGFRGDGGSALDARLNSPRGVVATPDGGALIADTNNHRVRRVEPDGRISTVAGTGVAGFSGDLGPAAEAQLSSPVAVSLVPEGGYLIADRDNHRVRYVWTEGTILTYAGTGEAGDNGEGLPPAETQLNEPRGMVGLGNDTVLVTDSSNHRVRMFAAPADLESPPVEQARPDEESLPPAAPPVAGQRMNAAEVRGDVQVKLPGSGDFVPLDGAASIPVGSVVDSNAGAVRITSAANLKGRRQKAVFFEGAFEVAQKRARRPVTDLVLRGGSFTACKAVKRRARASTSPLAVASRQRARRGLWGSGHGRFRTRGRHGAATVRGTIWYTADRCEGTFVSVKRGVVAVRDFGRKRQVLVPAGKSYLARARR